MFGVLFSIRRPLPLFMVLISFLWAGAAQAKEPWHEVHATLGSVVLDVSIGPSGYVWYLSKITGKTVLFRFKGKGVLGDAAGVRRVATVPGGSTRLAAGKQRIWVVEEGKALRFLRKGHWSRFNVPATDVGVDAKGTVWVTSQDGAIFTLDERASKWIRVKAPFKAKRIAVSNPKTPWATDQTGAVYWCHGRSQVWTEYKGRLPERDVANAHGDVENAHVDVAVAGRTAVALLRSGVFAVDASSGRTQWGQKIAGATSAAISAAGEVLVVKDGKLWRTTQETQNSSGTDQTTHDADNSSGTDQTTHDADNSSGTDQTTTHDADNYHSKEPSGTSENSK